MFNIKGIAINDFAFNDGLIVENCEFNIEDEFNSPFHRPYAIELHQSHSLEVNNCTFDGIEKSEGGIDLESCPNFTISNSQFNTLEEAILVSEKTKDLDISNCTFTSNTTAIKSSFANQSFGEGDITYNNFTGNTIDIHSTGAWSSLDIQNNNFSGQQYGILADGDNTYNISNNTFYNSYAGSILYSNGENETGHFQNQINTIVGIHSLKTNKFYQFLDNCFSTNGGDIYIDGEVSKQIGDENREAGNCFTNLNIPDISASGVSFEYYRPDTKIGTCSDPVTQSGYIEINGFENDDLGCGSGVTYTGPTYNYCNINFKTLTCAQASTLAQQILIQINTISNSTYTNLEQKEYLLARLRMCRAKLLMFMLGCITRPPHEPTGGGGDSFNYPTDAIQARNELKNSINKYESAAYVGLAIESGLLADATAYLSTMPYTDNEMLDFKEVQLINIQYQTLRDSFELSPSQSDQLYNIGQKSDPLAAYARGLYHQLAGEIIYPDIPTLAFNRSASKSNNLSHGIYPNPFNEYFTINVDHPSYLRIADLNGQIVVEDQNLEGQKTFITSLWHTGIYIVNISTYPGESISYKIIKL